MTTHHRTKNLFTAAALVVLLISLQASLASGQVAGGFVESGSFAPPPSAGIPMLPATGIAVRPSDVGNFPGAPLSCVPEVIHTAEELGIPAGGNLDALSSGNDVVPSPQAGPALGGLLAAGQVSNSRYSVNPTSMGLPVNAVRVEAMGGDGVASDVYEVGPFGLPAGMGVSVYKDAECIFPLGSPGGETDLDAIDRGLVNAPLLSEYNNWVAAGMDPATFPPSKTYYPVFYSVDAPTAAAMGVDPSDILWVPAPAAPPAVLIPAALMGLVPGDDIDGLAIDASNFRLCFTLTSTSPSAAFPYPSLGALGGAGVFEVAIVPAGGFLGLPAGAPFAPGLAAAPIPWATATQMGLLVSDEMNALAIGDPIGNCGPPQHPGTGEDFCMSTGVMGPLNHCDLKFAGPGDVVDILVESPGGTFDWEPYIIAAQVFTNQFPTSALPGLHINGNGGFILVNGSGGGSGVFGPPPLLPGGNFHSFQITPSAPLNVQVEIQAMVLTSLGNNNILVTSDAHVLVLP